jgi:hypothetical protein
LLQDVPADARLLCDKDAVTKVTIKGTPLLLSPYYKAGSPVSNFSATRHPEQELQEVYISKTERLEHPVEALPLLHAACRD